MPPTPAPGTEYVIAGIPLEIEIEATDPDTGDEVTLDWIGFPSDPDVLSYAVTGETTNCSIVYHSVPGDEGIHIITLLATDNHGAGAEPIQIVVNVVEPEMPIPELSPIILFGIGLLGIVGYIGFMRSRNRKVLAN